MKDLLKEQEQFQLWLLAFVTSAIKKMRDDCSLQFSKIEGNAAFMDTLTFEINEAKSKIDRLQKDYKKEKCDLIKEDIRNTEQKHKALLAQVEQFYREKDNLIKKSIKKAIQNTYKM